MAISLEADPTLAQGYLKVNGTTAATFNATGIITGGVPTGAVMPFAMNTAPTGWLAANGATVSRTTYALLFTAIGTLYGAGNESTTFALPDLRGHFVRGAGSDGTVTAGTFGAKQADDFKSHTHTTNAANSNGGMAQAAGNGAAPAYSANWLSGATGGTETRPANIALLYCVKF